MKGEFCTRAAACALMGVLVMDASAQQIFYPAKGQSQSKQSSDLSACQQWAKSNTGIDPTVLAQQANQPPPQQATGGRVRGGAGGAAAGAAMGAVAGDAGKGAAMGAVGGAMVGASRQRRANRASANQQAANSQQVSQQMGTFNKAVGACMSGRGYTVQ